MLCESKCRFDDPWRASIGFEKRDQRIYSLRVLVGMERTSAFSDRRRHLDHSMLRSSQVQLTVDGVVS